jgi:hypothetical protein
MRQELREMLHREEEVLPTTSAEEVPLHMPPPFEETESEMVPWAGTSTGAEEGGQRTLPAWPESMAADGGMVAKLQVPEQELQKVRSECDA